MNKLYFVIFIVTVACGCVSAQEQKNCAAQAPPKDAYVDGNHGYFFFIYPKVIPNRYFGCQITWNEKGEKVSVIRFENGIPAILEGYEGNQLIESCKIEDKEETEDDQCPNLDSVNYGLEALKEASSFEVPPFNLVVPPERDPRR